MRPARQLLEPALVAILLAAAGVLFSRNLHTAPSYDEGVYLASLDALRDGQTLGSEVFASQPPGFYLLLRLVALPSDSVAGVRIGFLLVAVLGCLGAYLLGRALAGIAGGLAAAGLLAIAPPFPSEAPRVTADVPSVSLSLVALGLAAYGFRRRAHLALPALAGAALAAAVSVKLLAATAVVPFAALAVSRRPSRRALLAAAAGVLTVALALVAAFAGVLGDLWDGAVRFHLDARSFESEGDNAQRLADLLDWGTPFAVAVALAAAAAATLVVLVRRPLRAWPLWLWAAASALFLLAQKPLFDHQLVLLSAALAAAAGVALGRAGRLLDGRRLLAAAVVGILALALGYWQQVHRIDYAVAATAPAVSWGVAQFSGCTRPGDVVVSDQPIVAFRARRPMPGELVDTSFVRFASRSLSPERVLELIRRERVRAVFAGRTFLFEPRILAGLDERFDRRAVRGDVRVYGCGERTASSSSRFRVRSLSSSRASLWARIVL